jgi:hypothetical protein
MSTQRKICWLALLLMLAGYGAPQVHAQDKTKKSADRQTGFKSIFNGKDLTGWEGDPERLDIPSYVCPALVSGGATPSHSKWVANEPSPRAVRLAAGDLDRIH